MLKLNEIIEDLPPNKITKKIANAFGILTRMIIWNLKNFRIFQRGHWSVWNYDIRDDTISKITKKIVNAMWKLQGSKKFLISRITINLI